jgi:hypothetical protein
VQVCARRCTGLAKQRRDGAYRASREGPRDIVSVPNWFTCCEILPELPSMRDAQVPVQRIARLREHCGSVSRAAGRVSVSCDQLKQGVLRVFGVTTEQLPSNVPNVATSQRVTACPAAGLPTVPAPRDV